MPPGRQRSQDNLTLQSATLSPSPFHSQRFTARMEPHCHSKPLAAGTAAPHSQAHHAISHREIPQSAIPYFPTLTLATKSSAAWVIEALASFE